MANLNAYIKGIKLIKMVGTIIALILISPIVGFMIVYQWFNLRGIRCIDCLDNVIYNLNKVAVAVPIEE